MNCDYHDYEAAIPFARPEEGIEWSQIYEYETGNKTSPRVLMIGDSICNGYQASLRQILSGKVTVSYWIGSKCVTSPGYFRELNDILSAKPYALITFNNGLHSLSTPLDAWGIGYRKAVEFIRAKCPGIPLAIVNSTPMENAEQRETVAKLNVLAEQIATEQKLSVIDLFSPMNLLEKDNPWSDGCHFKAPAIEQQATIMAKAILSLLKIEG